MTSIIRQNIHPPSLPDFRNLGTVLRVLIAVTVCAAVCALARVEHVGTLYGEWLETTGVVEPCLLLVLALLWAASPWLSRQSFGLAACAVVFTTLAAVASVFAVENSLLPQPRGTLMRWCLFGLIASGTCLLYTSDAADEEDSV